MNSSPCTLCCLSGESASHPMLQAKAKDPFLFLCYTKNKQFYSSPRPDKLVLVPCAPSEEESKVGHLAAPCPMRGSFHKYCDLLMLDSGRNSHMRFPYAGSHLRKTVLYTSQLIWIQTPVKSVVQGQTFFKRRSKLPSIVHLCNGASISTGNPSLLCRRYNTYPRLRTHWGSCYSADPRMQLCR